MKLQRILAISGSLRTDSYNRKLLRIAKTIAESAGTQVEEIDLRKLALPIYDGDIEARGMPENVERFKEAIAGADVLLLASPEYNHSVSGALKNAIDWLSRGGNSLDGKVAAIFGASDGRFGTLRGQFHLRQILSALNVFILPQPQVLVGPAEDAFTEDGALRDPKTGEQLRKLVVKTLAFAKTMKHDEG